MFFTIFFSLNSPSLCLAWNTSLSSLVIYKRNAIWIQTSLFYEWTATQVRTYYVTHDFHYVYCKLACKITAKRRCDCDMLPFLFFNTVFFFISLRVLYYLTHATKLYSCFSRVLHLVSGVSMTNLCLRQAPHKNKLFVIVIVLHFQGLNKNEIL